jgi:hypothetical protein
MKSTNLYLKFYLLTFFIFFIAAKPARAFEITPVKSLLTVDPGISQTVVIKIKNTPSSKGAGLNLTFKLSVLGVSQDEDGRPVFSRGTDMAENWVYPENNLVKIKSGEIKSVNFIIKIPADALAGSHYLGLAVEPVLSPTGGKEGDQASLQTRLVSLLTLQVKGMVEESMVIEKWAPFAGVTDKKNWKFDLSLKNNGTIEALLRGTIAIKNWQGEELFSEPITLGNKLLAGSRRVLHPEITLRNDINLPGLYQAQVKINYGLTNQMVLSIAYIWYFPQWSRVALAIIALLLVSLVIFVAKIPRKIKNR